MLTELTETLPESKVKVHLTINIPNAHALEDILKHSLLHLNDFEDLCDCPLSAYARKGRLSCAAQLTTPLCSEVTDSQVGETVDTKPRRGGTSYQVADSIEWTVWRVLPSGKDEDYEIFGRMCGQVPYAGEVQDLTVSRPARHILTGGHSDELYMAEIRL